MPGIGSRLVLALDVQASGAAQATSQVNAFGAALNSVTRNTQVLQRGQADLGRTVSHTSVLQSKGMRDAAQSTFRYTFYALMALRAGQAIVSRFYIKGMTRPAEEYEQVWTRVGAVLQGTKQELSDMQSVALGVSRSLPFMEKDVGNAILEMARAGMKLNDIKRSIQSVGELAMVAEVGLADAGVFVTQMLQAYNIKAERAGEVTHLLAYYQDKAVYTTKQLMEILGGVGGTGAAYGQNIAQVLQLATAFSKMGTAAGEADTLIRQLYMNAAKPDVYEAMKFGLEQLGMAPLYNEYGQLGNLGEAFLGFSKFLDETLQSMPIGEERAEMAAKINEVIYKLFGVRSSRAFFQIAKMDPAEFKALYTTYDEMVTKSAEYTNTYIEKLKMGYQYSKQMAAVAGSTLARQLGTPILTILKPLHELTAQFSLFGSELLSSESSMSRIVPMVLFLTTATLGLAGAAGIAGGAYLLLKMRMADVGHTLLQEYEQGGIDWVGHLRGKGYMRGIERPSTARIGLSYFRSIAAAPLRLFSSAIMLGGAAYLAYQKNFLGFRTFGDRMAAWWNRNMRGSDALSTRLANKLKAYSTLTKDASGKETGTWFAYLLRGFRNAFGTGGFLAFALKALQSAAHTVGWIFTNVVIPPIRFLAKILFRTFGWIMKWGAGAGDMEAAMDRLGKAIGTLATVLIIDRTIVALRNFAGALKSVWGWMTRGKAGPLGLYRFTAHTLAPITARGIGSVYQAGARGYRWARRPDVVARALSELPNAPIPRVRVGGRWMSREQAIAQNLALLSTRAPNEMSGLTLSTARVLQDKEFLASRIGKSVGAEAARASDRNFYRYAIWQQRLNDVPLRMMAGIQASRSAGYLYRVQHPWQTGKDWWAARQSRGFVQSAGQLGPGMTSTAGMGLGAASFGRVVMAVLPWLVGIGALAAIIYFIGSAFGRLGVPSGAGSRAPTYVANVTINGNVEASPERITEAVQQGLASAARQAEITQVEDTARRGELQPAAVGA